MIRFVIVFIISLVSLPALASHTATTEDTFNYDGYFGAITVYHNSPTPKNIVIFFSGAEGWNKEMADMARKMMAQGSLVVGVDTPLYIENAGDTKGPCVATADHVELLSHYIQQKYGLTDYQRAIVVGYGPGAPLVYASLAAAETGTFKGGISIGFCPSVKMAKAFCLDNGMKLHADKNLGFVFEPLKAQKSPWVVLQGASNKNCSPAEASAFIKQVGRSSIVQLPAEKNKSWPPKNWANTLQQVFDKMAAVPEPGIGNTVPSLSDLPIVEVPATLQTKGDTFAVLITGDGGWAGIDRDVSAGLAAEGIPVVGLSSLRYFWRKHTPEEASKDLQRIIEHYANAWGKKRVILTGYSFGADTLPFMVSRLPQNYKAIIAGVAMLGLSDTTKFEYQVPGADFFDNNDQDKLATAPEIKRLKGLKLLCIYGDEETDDPCPNLPNDLIHKMVLTGGHHFGGDYEAIAREIAKMAK
jgi:type IV secretory pathway VirJ component